MTDNDKTPVTLMADAMLAIGESMHVVQQAVTGYRASCETQGFSSAVCDALTIQYHQFLIEMLLRSMPVKR